MCLVLTIASTSANNVWFDSSFRLVPCILSSATKIKYVDLLWRSYTPYLLLAVVGPIHHATVWPHWYSFDSSLKMSCLVLHWPQQNLCYFQFWWLKHTLPLLDINLWSACMKALEDSEFLNAI